MAEGDQRTFCCLTMHVYPIFTGFKRRIHSEHQLGLLAPGGRDPYQHSELPSQVARSLQTSSARIGCLRPAPQLRARRSR